MSREKQIEEIKRTLYKAEGVLVVKDAARIVAETLYTAGYRRQEWISVEDRLPEHYEYCLLFLDNETMEIGWFHEVAKKFVVGGLVTLNMVTHWMPLPEAPKMKGESNDT